MTGDVAQGLSSGSGMYILLHQEVSEQSFTLIYTTHYIHLRTRLRYTNGLVIRVIPDGSFLCFTRGYNTATRTDCILRVQTPNDALSPKQLYCLATYESLCVDVTN